MPDVAAFDSITEADAEQVGGKGLSLGLMSRVGLPVPPGFCITADAYRRHINHGVDEELRASILTAYRSLGSGLVAVRSSATAEDGVAASFAGQQETYLGILGDDELCDAVHRCWASLQSDRAKSYRERQGIGEMAMSVVVQKLVAAESAGVLFTRDPMHPNDDRMIIEASWGLGETVVSGRVTPDRYVVDRAGVVVERVLGRKSVERRADGEHPVEESRQQQFCLNDLQLDELARLGRKVEDFYGQPRDIEWAWADGQVWLLQARPITTAGAGDREQLRREEIESLRKQIDPHGTVWVRFNLAEILPQPTPMTWAVVERMMSGQGGYGRMFADLGFPPDPDLDHTSVYDLIAGRPYMNLSREPRMQWGKLPFRHDFADLKANPNKATISAAMFRPKGASLWMKIVSFWRLGRGMNRFRDAARTFAKEFREQIIPPFVAEAKQASLDDWSKLDPPALIARFEHWVQRTLVDFARHSLKPTAFAAGSLARLQQLLEKKMPPEEARQAAAGLAVGIHPDDDADLPKGLRDLALNTTTRESFVDKFGHRASEEMELSSPRWNEDAGELDRVLTSASYAGTFDYGANVLDSVAAEAKIHPMLKMMLKAEVNRLRIWVALRESGKHQFLRGYALIRRALVELDRRFGLNGGIWFLTPSEFPDLLAGKDLSARMMERRKRRSILLSLEAPAVIFSDDLEALGRPLPPLSGADSFQGIALSAGVAEGPALVLVDPHAPVAAGDGYILVCPSTDPSWVPLFARARGLVMETGGVLSHGAIVAREFGLPAVAGLPDATRQIQTGRMLRVDGRHGVVSLLP